MQGIITYDVSTCTNMGTYTTSDLGTEDYQLEPHKSMTCISKCVYWTNAHFWSQLTHMHCSQMKKIICVCLRKFQNIFCSYSCKGFNDLNSFFAIVFGLMNGAISRLKNTWEVSKYVLSQYCYVTWSMQKVPTKLRRKFDSFETLTVSMTCKM